MPRFSPLFVFLFTIGLQPAAGVAQPLLLRGSLAVQGGESFTYMLQVTDSAGVLKGSGTTWSTPDKSVRATLTGYLDRTDSTLSFRESAIVENNGFESEAIICLLTATLRYHRNDSKAWVLSGPITSSDLATASCARGTLMFSGRTVDSLFARRTMPAAAPAAAATTPPATPKPKPVIVYDTARSRPVMAAAPQRITAGSEKEIIWKSNTIELDVWDGGRPDGDIITVMCNNRPVLSRYTITRERRHISIPFPEDTRIAVVSILSLNEGSEPPNTTDVALQDGATVYPVVAYNSVGREAKIRLRKAE